MIHVVNHSMAFISKYSIINFSIQSNITFSFNALIYIFMIYFYDFISMI